MLLGLLQGLFEFLPVSSSGHLVMARSLLGIRDNGMAIDIALHAGTLFSILYYYRKDLIKIWKTKTEPQTANFLVLIVLGILPAAVTGLFLADLFDSWFMDPRRVLVTFPVTGLILFSTRYVHPESLLPINLKRAFLIGLCQIGALFPGISRSGVTISAGIHLKISRKEAADFSFLMFIPLLIGALVLHVRDFTALSFNDLTILMTGVLTAFLSGLAAIHLVHILLIKEKFHFFAWYLWLVTLAGWFVFR